MGFRAQCHHGHHWLDDGDLDLTVLSNLAGTPSLNLRPLVRERLWAVAPPSEGLRGDQPVPFARAAEHPLVMPAAGHALRGLIDGAAGRAAVEMDVVVQTHSMRVQKQLVRAGHGWTILPGLGIVEDVTDGTLSAAPLCAPDVWRSIVLATSRAGRHHQRWTPSPGNCSTRSPRPWTRSDGPPPGCTRGPHPRTTPEPRGPKNDT